MNSQAGNGTSDRGGESIAVLTDPELLGYMHELAAEMEQMARTQGHEDLSRIFALARARIEDLRDEQDR